MPLKAHSGLTHLIRKSSRTSGCIIQITDHTSLSCARKSSNYRAPTVVMQLEQRILPQDSSGIDPIISPLYHHKGWLRKMGGKFKSWKKRYFILEGYQLSYFTNPEELRLLGKLSLKETQVEVPQLQDNDFGLDHKGYLFVIKSGKISILFFNL
ncbi:unnamed protein product [Dicrocoelium dendriticum]|nr:unnamed protein product [Dicrocoelium dendriticum]